MKPTHALLALAPLALAAHQTAAVSPTPRSDAAVQVAGIMSQRALTREGDFGEETAFMGAMGAVRVVLEVDLERVEGAGQRRIVEVLRADSRLSQFVDDRGTDLAAGVDDFGGPFEMMPSVSGDGLRAAVVASTDTAAAQGATRVELAGSLALYCASKKERVDSASAALEKGAKLEVGPYSFEITKIGEPDWGDAEASITLRSQAPLGGITGWWLVAEDGGVQELEPSMSMSFGSTTDQTLDVPKEVARGQLRLEYWADGERLEVPFEVAAGIGL